MIQFDYDADGATVATLGAGLEAVPNPDALRPLRGHTLAIVGFSETTRHQAPYDDSDVEIWICNRLALQDGVTRWDRHFDLHPLEWSAKNHHPENWRTYKEWLSAEHDDRLIYLPAPDPDVVDVPNAVSYPLDDVLAEINRRYLTSAIGIQLALALLLHTRYGAPKRIELYGIDLRSASEYEFQRPNAEWLLGIAEGRGIEVVLPKESALLNADNRSPIYGLEMYSGFWGELEKAYEERLRIIADNKQKLLAENTRILDELKTWHGAEQECGGWLERVRQYRRGGKL